MIPDHSLLQMLAATGAGSFPPAAGGGQAGVHIQLSILLPPKWLHLLIDPPAFPPVSHECHGYSKKKKKNHLSNSSTGTLRAFTSEALIDTAHQRAPC